MVVANWTVYWNERSTNVYLHGTKLLFHGKDHVEFRNELMPPGTVIKEWYSKTNFQTQKIEPSLPMIDGESNYRIVVNMDSEGTGKCLVRLVFYDRYEKEAGSLVVKGGTMDFKCPLKTYSYRMQLINGGVNVLHYYSINIQEIEDEQEETEKRDENIK